jgi:hypothetical protein
VKSTTHSWFGRLAVKPRSTRSGGRAAALSAVVVTTGWPRRTRAVRRCASAARSDSAASAGARSRLAAQLMPHLPRAPAQRYAHRSRWLSARATPSTEVLSPSRPSQFRRGKLPAEPLWLTCKFPFGHTHKAPREA